MYIAGFTEVVDRLGRRSVVERRRVSRTSCHALLQLMLARRPLQRHRASSCIARRAPAFYRHRAGRRHARLRDRSTCRGPPQRQSRTNCSRRETRSRNAWPTTLQSPRPCDAPFQVRHALHGFIFHNGVQPTTKTRGCGVEGPPAMGPSLQYLYYGNFVFRTS